MSFPWTEYLRLARELAFRDNDEAAMRSAVSRSYYAAYHAARNHRAAAGAESSRFGPHQAVWNALAASGNPAWKKAGNLGRNLVIFRQRADYEDDFPGLLWHARKSLGIAEDIIRLLS